MRSQERAKVIVLAGDAFLSGLAISISWLVLPSPSTDFGRACGAALTFILSAVCSFYLFDLYDLSQFNGIRTIYRIGVACAAITATCSSVFYVFAQLSPGRGHLIISIPLLALFTYGWRTLSRRSEMLCPSSESVLVIGTLADAMAISDVLNGNARDKLLGVLRTDVNVTEEQMEPVPSVAREKQQHAVVRPEESSAVRLNSKVLDHLPGNGVRSLGWASADKLEELTRENVIRSVIFRMDSTFTKLAPSLAQLRFKGVRVYSLPDFYMQVSDQLPLDLVSEEWLSCAEGFELLHIRMLRRLKRLTDVVLSAFGLLVSFPLMILTAVAIKLESPGPIFIKQRRVGWMGEGFDLLKFRSMHCNAEADGRPQWARENDPRITRVGRIIRTFRIDELPQMINVICGKMSFVGPRPERPEFVDTLQRLIPFYQLRHYVPPGITGWAQVKFPYGASIEDARRKLQYDLFYIRHASPLTDFGIVLRTAKVVLFQRGGR
jgi:lipopolysaccharide/colanic/teichoic acid biosynthesis glycosyltransferase